MAELVLLNTTNSLAGQLTSDMFGHIEPTQDPQFVKFKLDRRLENFCAAMGTKMVDGMEVRATEVSTMEVPDRFYDAITASISIGLLRRWSSYYVKAGMPHKVLDLLKQGLNMAEIARSDIGMDEGADLRTSALLTFDFGTGVNSITQFIQNLDNPVQAVVQRVNINDLALDDADSLNFVTGEIEDRQDVYVSDSTWVELLYDPVEQVQGFTLLDQYPDNVPLDSQLKLNDPDSEFCQAQGTISMFVPVNATRQDRQELLDVISRGRLRKTLVTETTQIEADTVKVVPRYNPQLSDTPVLESGNANEPTPDIPHRTLESNDIEDDIVLDPGSDQQYMQDPEPENRPRNGYGFDY